MNAIEKLEKAKYEITYAISNDEVLHYNDTNYQEVRLIIKRLAEEMGVNTPPYIKDCRTIDEAVTYIFNSGGDMADEFSLKNWINIEFNQYIDYLEENQIEVKIIHVPCETPEHLTFAHIIEDLAKCEKRFNEEDYSGAITSARSLVEGVCNEILFNLMGEELKDKLDLPALFKKVRKQLNLNTDNPNLEAPLKQVISGLINIVNGLAEIRNENGDAHHRRYDVNRHHALLVINSAKTVVTFLFNTYEYQLEKGTLVKV